MDAGTVSVSLGGTCGHPAIGMPVGAAALRLAVLALAVVGTACTAAPPGANPLDPGSAGLRTEADHTLARIEALIGGAPCSADTQCRVAAVGHLPCGGPESHRAWSTATTEASALADWLDRHAAARQRLHAATGLLSTCEVRPTPAVRCERPDGASTGRCVLVPGRGAGVR